MKKLICILAVFLTACGFPANEKPEKIRHAAHTVNSVSMINKTAMRLKTDKATITRIEYNSKYDYYTAYAYSETLKREICVGDDLTAFSLSEFIVNSDIIRLYSYPNYYTVEIIQRK